MEETIVKNDVVEVTSDEEGFKGAWYRAILEENPKTKSGREKLRVRYTSLLNDDGSTLLTEMIERKFIRPVPPVEDGVVLVEGSVVDANHNDGFWTGVVIKKSEDENKLLVYFDFPPDVIEFERYQLRAHFDWTGSNWARPEIQELSKSEFSPGTMVEVSSVMNKEEEVVWFPAMIIKEIDDGKKKKFIVKDCNHKHYSRKCNVGYEARPNTTVDSSRVRPTPPSCVEEEYQFLDRVEAFRGGFGWHEGLVSRVLSEKQYMVSLEATEEEFVFKDSELRPFQVWEDGVWHDRTKPNPLKETPSNVEKKKSMNPITTPKRVAQLFKADAVMMNDKAPPMVITPEVTSLAKDSVSPVTPSSVLTATPSKQTAAETSEKTLEPMKKNQSNMPEEEEEEEENNEEKSQKRKRELEQEHSNSRNDASNAEINDTSKRICSDGDNVDDQPHFAWIRNLASEISPAQTPKVVNVTQAKDTTVLPFTKKSPVWKTFESMKGSTSVPQSPHFSPLLQVKEDIREYSAIGMTMTFYRLLDEIKDLRFDVPTSGFNSISDSLSELEKHGFDVAIAQSRIEKMLYLKDKKGKKAEERKRIEKKIEEEESERRNFEEEIAELGRKILMLKRQETLAKENKEEAEKKVVEMKTNVERIDKEIEDTELQFQKIVPVPW